MKNNSATNQILFVTSYPPRECGIATYSKDLRRAITGKFDESLDIKICALENGATWVYPDEVQYTLQADNWREYISMAEKINANDSIRAVFVQHEFGLFGGKYGDHLLFLLYSLQKPASVTFHTVLPNPDSERLRTVRSIADLSSQIVVMTNMSAEILEREYGVPRDKVKIIPHGTHMVRWKGKLRVKDKLGLRKRLVLSTFGLLSSNKSIETAIEAIPAIREEFPNVLYMILGRTHPGIVRLEGEQYRNSLRERVRELGIEENVCFVNKYLDLDELLDYLRATDVYLFTSKDPNQAVSGTFSYAMSCGCPIVSTPIPHAKEMISEGGGVMVEFANPMQLARATNRLLADKHLREEIGKSAFQHTRATVWENVAIDHVKLFTRQTGIDFPGYSFPAISTTHILELTDATGMIQFCDISEPDLDSGYTLDDNARALISMCMHYRVTGDLMDKDLMNIYMSFIQHCQLENGKFLNYVDQHGIHCEKNHYVNLEDSNGRTCWSLGYIMGNEAILDPFIVSRAEDIFDRFLPRIEDLVSPRAIAFCIKGLYEYNRSRNVDEINTLVESLADKLFDFFHAVQSDRWGWFETKLTYGNAVLPEAMLMAYLMTGNSEYREVAKNSMQFLLSRTFSDDFFRVVSNRGWMDMNDEDPQTFGEQPIDVAYTVMALDLFNRIFPYEGYDETLAATFEWFLGRNHLGQVLYNQATGGCYDGLEENNVNLNQGAESTVCYLMSRLVMEELKIREEHQRKTVKAMHPRLGLQLLAYNRKKGRQIKK